MSIYHALTVRLFVTPSESNLLLFYPKKDILIKISHAEDLQKVTFVGCKLALQIHKGARVLDLYINERTIDQNFPP